MSEFAKVDSIDGLHMLRSSLLKVVEEARSALTNAEADLSRTLRWVEHEQHNYWQGQLHKRGGSVEQATASLRRKKMFPTATGATPSTVDEEQALAKAKMQFDEAEGKLQHVRRWSRELAHEFFLYKGQIQPVARAVEGDIPAAIATLGDMIEALGAYVSLTAPRGALPVELEGQATDDARQSRSNGIGEISCDQQARYRRLRLKTPVQSVRNSIPLARPTFSWGTELQIDASQQRLLRELPIERLPVNDQAKVILAAADWDLPRLFLERSRTSSDKDSGWFVGTIDTRGHEPHQAIRIVELVDKCPALKPLLTLPSGYLIVLDLGTIEAVLDANDCDVWDARQRDG